MSKRPIAMGSIGVRRTRPLVFWIATFAAITAVVILLREVLLPFVAGMALAYLFNPLASRIERLGVNRLVATLAIIAFVVALISIAMVLTVPVIVRELWYFGEHLPLYVRRVHTLATDPDRPWVSRIVGEGLNHTERSIGELTRMATSWFDTILRSLWSGGRALISIVSLGIVTPIVACYLLYDWDKMIATVDNWVPPAHRETVRMLAREVDKTISGFVRGQSFLCLVLAVYYAAALKLIGLEHGILVGVVAGLISFIPYLGALSGLVVSVCIAIAQFSPDWKPIWLVLAIFIVGQALADYVLAPNLVGRRVHLNPVWVMFALFAFGYLFGFVGLLVAVPLASAIGVLTRFSFRTYYASSLYASSATAATETEP
ncbi:AI-2E family transporter [Bradyrhizobium sp. Leo121]|uniref:AI-2E family transporter n=1 Tax=Bradyrhizobium sp. Leo121 TaxID=1571195 RepID=UPI001FDECE89|nr:AI-2E family transporter [Bradyrhizobium sp. Leo121]